MDVSPEARVREDEPPRRAAAARAGERPGTSAARRGVTVLQQEAARHPLFSSLHGIGAVRVFLEHHVFAVWDFMLLLKTLQREFTSVSGPWVPKGDPELRRFINEIVLGEESDEDGRGGYRSHLEMYLDAMAEVGADTTAIERLLEGLRGGLGVRRALACAGAPEAACRFVEVTLNVVERGRIHEVAAAFALGRERVIPDMFRRIVGELATAHPTGLVRLRHYLDRHIEVDGEEHGPLATRLLESLCQADPTLWAAAEAAAEGALAARVGLWDGVLAAIRAARPDEP